MARYALLTADVGRPDRYHVGDQAIMTANLEWVRTILPPERIRILSRAPEFSARIHGIEAIRPPKERFVRRELEKRPGPPGPGAWWSRSGRSLRRVARASLLHLCGGGNLTSLFAHELRLRSLYVRTALEAGVPVIVTGQTLGPDLDVADRDLLARWLPHVAHLGFRDRRSAELAAELGADEDALTVAVDDAYFLEAQEPACGVLDTGAEARRRPLVGLSLHHRRSSELAGDAVVANLARSLDALVERRDVGFLFLSHLHAVQGPPRPRDLTFGRRVRAGMRHGDRVRLIDAPLLDREIKHLSAGCDFFISTRYHGAVFALSSAVPTLLLTQDAHSRAKMHGLVDLLGLDAPVLDACSPELEAVLLAGFERRGGLRSAAATANERARAGAERVRGELAAHYRRAG